MCMDVCAVYGWMCYVCIVYMYVCMCYVCIYTRVVCVCVNDVWVDWMMHMCSCLYVNMHVMWGVGGSLYMCETCMHGVCV